MEQEMPIAAPPAEPAAKEAQPPRSDPYQFRRAQPLFWPLPIPAILTAIMEHAKAAGATGGTVFMPGESAMMAPAGSLASPSRPTRRSWLS